MRSYFGVIMMLFVLTGQAFALDAVKDYIPTAQKVGEARFTYMMWDVYDAVLYAPEGLWHPSRPFALSLHYLRDLKGADIAERSIEEMRKLGFHDEVRLAAWYSQMRDLFPDVHKGTVLIGVYHPGKATDFYLGSNKIGSIQSPEFGQWFFNIWLAENTSEPEFRKKLLAQ